MTADPRLQQIDEPAVRAVFEAFTPRVRSRLLDLRALVFETAESLPEVGPIVESLRWGQPAYLTLASKTGTTVRLGCKEPDSGWCEVLVHCQTDLIETFVARHGAALSVEGTRAVRVRVDGALPIEPLRDFIALALTYRLRKATGRSRIPSTPGAPRTDRPQRSCGSQYSSGRSPRESDQKARAR